MDSLKACDDPLRIVQTQEMCRIVKVLAFGTAVKFTVQIEETAEQFPLALST
jgi:hypothetical protein